MRKIFKPFIALALIAVLVLSSCYGHSHNYRLVEEVKASCEQDGVVAHYECDCGKYFDLDHNEITNIAISKLGHDLKHVEAKAAICTEAGNLEYWHCERCGKNYTSQDATTQITTIVVPALGHEYELKTVWNDDGTCLYELECEHDHSHKVIEGLNGTITHTDDTATCTLAGSVTYTLTLTYDGKTYTDTHTVQTGALEHDWKWVIDTPATDTTDGVKHEVCDRCGETRNEGTVIPHAHTHELQMVQGQSATETEAGFKAYYSCSCGKFFEDAEAQVEIADLAAWKAQGGRGYVAPTGVAPHQHSLTLVAKVDATETTAGHEAYYVCSSCGKAYTSQDDESTLIEDLTAWLAEGGAGYIAPVPHQHDLALVLMLPATETTAGYKAYYTCSCGKYFEDAQGEVEIADLAAWKAEGGRGYIAPTGVAPHQHELTLVQGKEATTTEVGYKAYYECSCGKYFEDEAATKEITDLDAWKAEGGAGYLPVVVVPHTHEYTKVEAKAASCTKDGNIEYYTCNVEGCGKLFTKSGEEYTEVTAADVVIPATGHSYGEWSVATLPSTNATGLATRECATCHHVDELTLPVVNEENYNAVIKTPATCGAKGVHTYTLKEDTTISFDLEDIEVSSEHGELQDAATNVEFKFNSKSWGDPTNSWKSNEDGNSCETANSARGVQCTATASATSKDVFKKVTKIVVVCSSNGSSGAENKIIIKIGDSTIEVAAAGSYTNTEKEFEFVSVSGQIELIVNRSGSKSVYIKSIEIFYTAEVRSLTKHEGTEPSCEIDGEKTYYECPICHKFFEDEKGTKEIDDIDTWKVIPALGHDYDTPTYEWKDGFCTATKVCKTDTSHVVTEQVTAAYVKDTNATCTENEKGHLVATFETEGFEAQSTEANSYVVENSALGHDYPDVPSRYSFENDKWYAEYDCSRCDDVKKEETTDVKVAINYVGFATLQAAIDSTEVGDIRKVVDTQITESIKLSRDVKFVSLNYNGDFDFNGHKLLLEGEVDKLTLKVSASVSDQEINDSITVVGKKIVIDRAGEIATVTFELDGQAVTIHKDGTHTAYQTLDEAIAAFDGALDEVIKLNAPLTANGSITITSSAVLDFETHDVTATSLVINDGVTFTVFNGRFLGSIDENDLMTGKLVIKAGYHAHVIEGGFDIHLLSLIHHDAVAVTCEDDGNVEYWECDRCHDKFADEDCTQEITDVVIPATGHNFGTPTYVWNDGECTASKVCTNDDSFVVIETVPGEYVKDTDATCEENEKGHLVATFKNEGFEAQSTEANSYVVENTALAHDWQPVNITWDGEDKFTAHANFVCSHDASHTKQEVATVTDDGKAANWYQEVIKAYTASFEGFESITKTEVFAKIPLVKASTIDSATNTIIYVIGAVSEEVNQYGTVFLGEFQLYSFGSDANGINVGDIVVASGKVYDYKNKQDVHTYEFKKDNTYRGNIEAVLKLHAKVSQTCTESGVKAYYTWNDLYFDIDDELNVTFIGDADAFNAWKSDGGAGYISADGHLFGKSEAAEDVIWDYTDVNKPVLQVRFKCSTCGEKSEFVTVYTESDSNYDLEKGVIVVNGRTYTATVNFEGKDYQYEVTRLKTVEEISSEVDADIDAINKSLYSDYTLPTSITVDAVDSLLQATELTYSWTFENAPATVITYTSPEQATNLTYHLCVKNGEKVLIADKEVVFTLVSYSSLNKLSLEFNTKINDTIKGEFVIQQLQGNVFVTLDDNFRLVPNHEYTMKVVSTQHIIKDGRLYYVENEVPIVLDVEFENDADEFVGAFTFTANGKDLKFYVGEVTAQIRVRVDANNATVYDDHNEDINNENLVIGATSVILTAIPAEGYRLESISVKGADALVDVDDGTIIFDVVASNIDITVTTVKTQKVTFNANYGDTPATHIETVDNGCTTLQGHAFARTGYQLTKWQTRTGEPGDYEYADFELTTAINEDVTLYAYWTANTYTVTFSLNDDTKVKADALAEGSKVVTYDAKYGELPTATRTYYTFEGWFTDDTTGTRVTADSDVAITAEQNLYAHWTKDQYTLDVTINNSRVDGQPMGSVTPDDVTNLVYDGTVVLTFSYHDASQTGNVVKVKSLTFGTDTTDYASAVKNNQYSLKIAANHIDLENSKIIVNVVFAEYAAGSGVNVTYTFTSKDWRATPSDWASGKDGSGFNNNGIQVTTTTTGANGTSPISYNKITRIVLTYNTNQSKGSGTVDVKIGNNDSISKDWAYTSGNGTTANYTLVYDYETPQSGNIEITLNTTQNSIYLVSVQVITSVEEVTYYNASVSKTGKGTVSGVPFANNEDTFTGAITTKELTFTPAEGYVLEKVLFGENNITDDLVSGKYTFDLSAEANAENPEIKVTFKRVEYTINYNGIDGASFASPNPSEYNVEAETFTLVNPTKTGYNFVGWSGTDLTGSNNTTVEIAKNSTGNREYTANWEAKTFTITLSADGADNATGESEYTKSVTATYGQALPEISVLPVKSGNVFMGYKLNEEVYYLGDGSHSINYLVDGDITLVGTFDAKLTVTFEGNGGLYGENIKDIRYYNNDGSEDIVVPNNPEKTGYTFTGYKLNNTGDLIEPVAITGKVTTELSYTAQWEKNKYTISYARNNESATGDQPADATGTYNEGYTTLANTTFALTGYVLTSWNTSADGKGTTFACGTAITSEVMDTISTNGTVSVTLYAVWTINTYTIAYNKNSSSATGDQPEATAKTYNVTYTTLSNTTFTLTGYTLSSWNTNANGEGTTIACGTEMTAEVMNTISSNGTTNVTLYAVWTANTYTIFLVNGTTDLGTVTVNYDSADLTGAFPTGLSDPSDSGLVFGGWALDDTNKTVVIDKDNHLAASVSQYTDANKKWIKTDDVTLYAKWVSAVSNASFIFTSAAGIANGNEIPSRKDGNITMSFAKGSNNNNTKYYTSGNSARMYTGNIMTVTADSGYVITSIKITFTTSQDLTPNVGTFSDDEWTGSSSTVTLTNSSSGQAKFTEIVVTYEPA